MIMRGDLRNGEERSCRNGDLRNGEGVQQSNTPHQSNMPASPTRSPKRPTSPPVHPCAWASAHEPISRQILAPQKKFKLYSHWLMHTDFRNKCINQGGRRPTISGGLGAEPTSENKVRKFTQDMPGYGFEKLNRTCKSI
jgi:hypothetical protein